MKVNKKVNFTAERVNSFAFDPGSSGKLNQTFYWDAKTPGLGLRVTAAGVKSFVFESRLHGKTIRITIGDCKTWPIGKAQAEATRLKAMTDQGIDPRDQKRELALVAEEKKKARAREKVTVAEAWASYLEANKNNWGERHYLDHVALSSAGGVKRKRGNQLTVAGPLAELMPLKLSDLDGDTVAEWMTVQSKTRPTSAALCYRLLRAFIRWAQGRKEYQGIVPENAYSAQHVKKAVPKAKAKDDCLQREQLKGWFAAVMSLPSPVISAYLQTLLLVGARREELGELRWEDVDFKWRSITLKDKFEPTRTIPLTPYVHDLLIGLKHLNETPPNVHQMKKMAEDGKPWKPSPWVFFSNASANGRIAEPRYAHNRALVAAGLPHISIHGLRRSFGTLCEWVEVPTGISAQIMGHKPSAIAEKHYRRRPLDLLRMWHEKIEAWILEQAGIEVAVPEAKPVLEAVN